MLETDFFLGLFALRRPTCTILQVHWYLVTLGVIGQLDSGFLCWGSRGEKLNLSGYFFGVLNVNLAPSELLRVVSAMGLSR